MTEGLTAPIVILMELYYVVKLMLKVHYVVWGRNVNQRRRIFTD